MRTLLISEVLPGRLHRTQRATCFNGPPPGFHSVLAVPGVDFAHEEIAVYNSSSIRPVYLVVYGESLSHSPAHETSPPKFTPGLVYKVSEINRVVPPVAPITHARAHDERNQPPAWTQPPDASPDVSNKLVKLGSSVALKRVTNLIRLNHTYLTLEVKTQRIQTLHSAIKLSEKNISNHSMNDKDAQIFLNAVQDVSNQWSIVTVADNFIQILNDPYIWLSDGTDPDGVSYAQIRTALRHVLMSVSINSDILPMSLFLSGVACTSRESIGGGSFGDVYRGTYHGEPVALKRLRTFRTSDEAKQAANRKVYLAFWSESTLALISSIRLSRGSRSSGRT